MKFGSASVPVYRSESNGRVRFIVCSYRDGKRIRKVFNCLDEAKKEALFVARRIQSGMQHVTDLKPHERDHYVKAVDLLSSLGLPLVAAVEDYVQARKLAESESLTSMANDYRRVFKPLTRRATVGQLVDELLVAKKQDGASKAYLANLKTVLTRFAAAFPGEILGISSSNIDGWLRGLNLATKSRNGMLICVKVLFSFARSQTCLPANQMTAAEQIKKVKVKDAESVPVFTPEEMEKLPHAARPHLIPILAIGAFSGIRIALRGMAAQRAPSLLHLLPHRNSGKRRPSVPRSGQLALDHLQERPRADHRERSGKVILDHAGEGPDAEYLPMGPTGKSRHTGRCRGSLIHPFHPRATMPRPRGMVL